MPNMIMLAGLSCVALAIFGGGLKCTMVRAHHSGTAWRQLLLGVFGFALVMIGLPGTIDPRPQGRAIASQKADSDPVSGEGERPALLAVRFDRW
jgi:hypothetical protein